MSKLMSVQSETKTDDFESNSGSSSASGTPGGGVTEKQITKDPADVPPARTCTLVAKWQGNAIELPDLSPSITIGEIKVSDFALWGVLDLLWELPHHPQEERPESLNFEVPLESALIVHKLKISRMTRTGSTWTNLGHKVRMLL